jgi:hypothetical protein
LAAVGVTHVLPKFAIVGILTEPDHGKQLAMYAALVVALDRRI